MSRLRVACGLSVVLLGALAAACHSQAPEAQNQAEKINLAGRYTCTGTNPDGGAYQGVVQIKKLGDAWQLTWQIGEESHEGIGLVTGNLLSVSWRIEGGGGVVVYTIKGTGAERKLDGKWTMFGDNGRVLDEDLTPLL
ncbi:MAG: hypothetical protein KY476_01765 [Planctomycetes bacterium]|nr:hypothetical protein [Planctomycetota bacterium]